MGNLDPINNQMNTRIVIKDDRSQLKISEDTKIRLKVLASYRGITYDQIINDTMDIYEGTIPFKNEKEFNAWFSKNFSMFGLIEIRPSQNNEPGDFIALDVNNNRKIIKLELISTNYLRQEHDSNEIDLIIAVFSPSEKIDSIPVMSFNLGIADPNAKIENN